MDLSPINMRTSFLVDQPTIAEAYEYLINLSKYYKDQDVIIVSYNIWNSDVYEGYRLEVTVDKKNG